MNAIDEIEILLVEDNVRDAELAMLALKKHNLINRLGWVQDGTKAMELLLGSGESANPMTRSRPKVILLDLKLPKVDGLELLRQLRTDPMGRTIFVVVLASSREEPDIERSYELGANSYIIKPVNFKNLSEAVAGLGMCWLHSNPLQEPRSSPGRSIERHESGTRPSTGGACEWGESMVAGLWKSPVMRPS